MNSEPIYFGSVDIFNKRTNEKITIDKVVFKCSNNIRSFSNRDKRLSNLSDKELQNFDVRFNCDNSKIVGYSNSITN